MEASGRRDGEEQVSASEASSHGPGAGALHHEEPGGWHLSSKQDGSLLGFSGGSTVGRHVGCKGCSGDILTSEGSSTDRGQGERQEVGGRRQAIGGRSSSFGTPRRPSYASSRSSSAGSPGARRGWREGHGGDDQAEDPTRGAIDHGGIKWFKLQGQGGEVGSQGRKLTKTTGDGHRDACGDGGGIDGRPEQCGDPGGGGRDVVATRREVPGHDVPGDADGHDHAREPDDWTPRFGRGHGDRVREFTRWSDATNRVGAVHPRRSVPSQLRVLPGAAPSENGDGRSLGQPHGDGGGSGDLGEGLRRSSGEEVNPWMVHQELKKGIATMVSQAWQQHERDRRLVSRSAKEVLEVMQTQWEQDIEKGLNETFMTAIRFGDKDNPLVSEIYTNTQRVMKEVSRRGHAVGTAMSLETGWNFLKEEDRKRAFQKVKEEKPYFLVLAFPCGPWSPLMNLNPALDLPQRRAEGLELIRFALDLAKLQASAGRHYLLENPLTSAAWKLEEVQKFLEEMDCYVADFHQCRFGLKGSTGKLHRKATRMVSSSKVLLWVLAELSGL